MPRDLLNIGWPQTFNLFKKNAVSVKHNKGKRKKTRCVCSGWRHRAASRGHGTLSHQLVLRKPEPVSDSGFTGVQLLGCGCPHSTTPEGTTCSTATASVRHMVASAAFCLCSLRDLRGCWDHLIKLPSHPG